MNLPTGLNPFDLTGRDAVVTGASRGIGYGIAEALAAAGADIIGVSANIDDSPIVGESVTALGSTFTPVRADFTDRARVLRAAARSPNSAPTSSSTTLARSSEHPPVNTPSSHGISVLEVNLSSQFALTQMVAAPMLDRGYGKVIFTASLLSFQGGINVPGYTASKSAIAGLTKALANEWAAQGVNVNAIAPGYIATDNTQALRSDPARSTAILDRIPAARWGRPNDIAGAAVFLASAASDYVSGIVLPVDGGWLGR